MPLRYDPPHTAPQREPLARVGWCAGLLMLAGGAIVASPVVVALGLVLVGATVPSD